MSFYVKVNKVPNDGKLYVYNIEAETFDPFVQCEETWAAMLGRRTVDAVFVIGGWHLLKWLGVIVHVTVQS